VQTFPGGTFYAPSGNISCQLDYPLHGQTVMACRAITRELDVQMGVTGVTCLAGGKGFEISRSGVTPVPA
jgi:hypothetical protein